MMFYQFRLNNNPKSSKGIGRGGYLCKCVLSILTIQKKASREIRSESDVVLDLKELSQRKLICRCLITNIGQREGSDGCNEVESSG